MVDWQNNIQKHQNDTENDDYQIENVPDVINVEHAEGVRVAAYVDNEDAQDDQFDNEHGQLLTSLLLVGHVVVVQDVFQTELEYNKEAVSDNENDHADVVHTRPQP